MSSFFFNF